MKDGNAPLHLGDLRFGGRILGFFFLVVDDAPSLRLSPAPAVYFAFESVTAIGLFVGMPRKVVLLPSNLITLVYRVIKIKLHQGETHVH